ncbi:MAG: hypothetical protein HDR09_21615 [Lachnospiraceae bacterium]|nr:hypothetical protein [Lachnospiraceae bacterium]
MWEIIELSKVNLFAGIFLAISILVVMAIMLDLWDGVHTARITKERVHSHKLRVTIDKMSEYWRFILIGFLIDCIGIIFAFYIIPFVAILFGIGLIIIEIKSMFEHAKRRKSHTTDLPTILKKIVECANEKDAHDLIDKITALVTEPKTTEKITATTTTLEISES